MACEVVRRAAVSIIGLDLAFVKALGQPATEFGIITSSCQRRRLVYSRNVMGEESGDPYRQWYLAKFPGARAWVML